MHWHIFAHRWKAENPERTYLTFVLVLSLYHSCRESMAEPWISPTVSPTPKIWHVIMWYVICDMKCDLQWSGARIKSFQGEGRFVSWSMELRFNKPWVLDFELVQLAGIQLGQPLRGHLSDILLGFCLGLLGLLLHFLDSVLPESFQTIYPVPTKLVTWTVTWSLDTDLVARTVQNRSEPFWGHVTHHVTAKVTTTKNVIGSLKIGCPWLELEVCPVGARIAGSRANLGWETGEALALGVQHEPWLYGLQFLL